MNPVTLQILLSLSPSPSSLSSSLSVIATIHNPTPQPITFLRWGTPLDPRADLLGIFHIHDETLDQPVVLDTVQMNRKWPPSEVDFVQILPASSVEATVSLPLDRNKHEDRSGHEFSVQAKGRWHGVWSGTAKEVIALEGKQAERGEFESNIARTTLI
ncbi:hypothetical protein EYZ11_005568 [Aspergillus tanneri]|uniref:Uncharacterized protein n=1 Tax=Aspergillus tanneri TaxID=1220188 RepID=A0A4S3JHK6_9EURO|nr:uncharacterized protein ATNIH1004_010990 [Aspergillus tanneri]KAA8642050.1 hypothetical protein ATNIH1004_010990 [Aspergillus tanneri]THC94929.1 hypothetical protein EYZ11_005568 [Aspergillus tanneri]